MKYLVLDEADKLLNMDFEKEINNILDILPKTRNTFLFSGKKNQFQIFLYFTFYLKRNSIKQYLNSFKLLFFKKN